MVDLTQHILHMDHPHVHVHVGEVMEEVGVGMGVEGVVVGQVDHVQVVVLLLVTPQPLLTMTPLQLHPMAMEDIPHLLTQVMKKNQPTQVMKNPTPVMHHLSQVTEMKHKFFHNPAYLLLSCQSL